MINFRHSITIRLRDASESQFLNALSSLIIQYSDASAVGKPGHGLHRFKSI